MTSVRRTQIFTVFAAASIILWTAVMSSNASPGDTVSEAVREWSARWWFIPVGIGCLFGHWFGPKAPAGWPRMHVLLASIGVAMFAVCALDVHRVEHWWEWLIGGVVGLIMGAAAWPLEREEENAQKNS